MPCKFGSGQALWTSNSASLKIDISGPPCVTEISSINLDLSKYQSYTVEYDWRLEKSTHMDRNFAILWKDSQNWIGLKLLDNSIIIQRITAGDYHIIPGSTVFYSFQADNSYHFKVTYEKNHHLVVSINDEIVIDIIDFQYPIQYPGSYGLAFQASVGAISTSTTTFDNLVVTSNDESLNVPLLKQG